jgi:hypothetical protein
VDRCVEGAGVAAFTAVWRVAETEGRIFGVVALCSGSGGRAMAKALESLLTM